MTIIYYFLQDSDLYCITIKYLFIIINSKIYKFFKYLYINFYLYLLDDKNYFIKKVIYYISSLLILSIFVKIIF